MLLPIRLLAVSRAVLSLPATTAELKLPLLTRGATFALIAPGFYHGLHRVKKLGPPLSLNLGVFLISDLDHAELFTHTHSFECLL